MDPRFGTTVLVHRGKIFLERNSLISSFLLTGINRLGGLLSDIRLKLNAKYSKSPALYSSIGMPTLFNPAHNDIYFFDPKKEYYEFTPTSQHPVFLKGKSWPTVSHYFHCQKYKDRPDIMGQIESCSGVDKAWAIAHDAKNMQVG